MLHQTPDLGRLWMRSPFTFRDGDNMMMLALFMVFLSLLVSRCLLDHHSRKKQTVALGDPAQLVECLSGMNEEALVQPFEPNKPVTVLHMTL